MLFPRRCLWTLYCPVVALLAPLASAQQVSTQTTDKPTVENVVELSPFTVVPDHSWEATTTLAGNRTQQEIAKIPASIDALTSEFIRDLNLGTVEDAAAFVPGLTVQPRLESRNDDGRISYRGLTGASNTSRNFFLWYVPSDTYNVERLDFSLGSNSLMFGDAAPGGQVAVYTKRPQFRSFADVYGYVQSFGTSRYQLDVNEALGSHVAVRMNLVDRVDGSYIHHTYQRQKAGDLSILFQPFKTTQLTIEGEAGRQVRRRGENAVTIQDVAAPGRAFSQNNRWYYTSDGTIFQRPSTSIPTVDTTAASGNSLTLLSGQSETVTMPGGIPKTFYGYSRYLNVLGPYDYLDRPYNVFQATFDQSIGKLAIEIAYNQQFQHQERNDNSFGTTQTPPVISVDGSGRPFEDMTGTAQYKDFGNIVKAGRVAVAYPFEFGSWMRQFVVVNGSRQRDFAHNRRFLLANAAAPGTLQNNEITLRAYLDDPRVDTSAYWSQFDVKNMPHTATFDPEIFETYANTAPFVDLRYTRSISASASGEYFGGKLTSMVGATWSKISRKIPALSDYALDSRGEIHDPGLPDQSPGLYVYDPGYDLTARSTLAGLTYEVLRKDWLDLRVYGDYSQSFNWQSATTFYGQALGPILGNTHEVGIKGDTLNQSLFFALGVYKIKRQNVGYVWSPDILSATQLEDLINPNNLQPGQPGYLPVTTSIVGSERRTVNSQEQSTGWDLVLQAKRYHGLQARLTASATTVSALPDFSAFKALLASAIARTNAANAPGGDPTLAENPTYIANAQTILNSSTSSTKVTGLRSARYGGSFVLDYEMPKVTGLRVGITGVLTPNYNLGIYNGIAYLGGKHFPLGTYAFYTRKVAGLKCTFRGGVQNAYDLLTGHSAYRKTGTTGFNNAAGTPNYVYRYTDPVTYSGAVDVAF